MKIKLPSASLAVLIAALPLTSDASSIVSWNYSDTSSVGPGESAGIVNASNWNNSTDNLSGLVDHTGTATAINLALSPGGSWRLTGDDPGLDADGTSNRRLLNGYRDILAANSPATLTLTGIPYDDYDIHVYFGSDGANRTLSLSDGATTFHQSTMGTAVINHTSGNAVFLEGSNTNAASNPQANYVVFRGRTGADRTITYTRGSNNGGFKGIQIVGPAERFGPDIVQHPGSTQLYAGRTARFSGAATGFPEVTVRWQKDGVDVADDDRISGANTTALTISNVSAADAGNYTLVATSTQGTSSSDPASLAIVTPSGTAYESAILDAEPLAYWRLNEPGTVDSAFDPWGGFAGTYTEAAEWGSEVHGPRSPAFPGFESDNTAVDVDGWRGTSHVSVPTPELNSNQVTFLAWMRPEGGQENFTGLLMHRGATQAGLGYTTDQQLGYTWNNNTTWTWQSNLRPPDLQWSFVALVIEPDKATLYLGSGGMLSAAVHAIPHTSEAWGGMARIGDDAGGADNSRTFWGQLDEVTILGRSLSFDEIADLYETATGIAQTVPPIISVQPQSVTRLEGSTIQFQAAATGASLTFQWQKDGANIDDDERISGATTSTLAIAGITPADAGSYMLVVTNPYGEAQSSPATLTVPETSAYGAELVALDPLSYWMLDETEDPASGNALVHDLVSGRDGTWGAAAQNGFHGIEGPRPATGFGGFDSSNFALQSQSGTANSWATVPGPGITTDTITFTAWVYPTAHPGFAGIVFARAGQPATGLNFRNDGELGYHWNDTQVSWDWASGVFAPLNRWSFTALVVEPNQATIHVFNADGVQTASQAAEHAPRAFTDNIRVGGDPNNVARTVTGRVDEAAIFDQALTLEQLQGLYETAVGAVPPAITGQPQSVEVFPGTPVQFTVAASGTAPLSYQWQRRDNGAFMNIEDGSNVSGATTATLSLSNVNSADAGEYRAVVTNVQGSTSSDAATLTVLTPPPAPAPGTYGAAVLESGALAYWRLNETDDPSAGNLQAFDYAGNSHALYGVAALNGFHSIAGPRPADGFNLFEETNTALQPILNTANSWVTAPGLGITTDSITITAWINPVTQPSWGGIIFARAGQPATGLNFRDNTGQLGYHWLDLYWGYESGLVVALNQWSFVALVVEPDQATLHVIDATGPRSAVNEAPHDPRAFTDAIRIGGDPNNVNRTFDGRIDEVAIFNRALTPAQVQAIFAGEAVAAPAELAITFDGNQITISWDRPGTLQSTTALEGDDTEWTDEETIGMSLTVTPTGPAKFYRWVE